MAHADVNQINVGVKPEVEATADSSQTMSSTGAGASHDSLTFPKAGSSNCNAYNQFEKPPRTFSKGKDIRETPKYHDVESYTNQRHHYIGTGVFNADNIDDLPPRYRTKVLNAYEWLAATFPQANMTASDIIAMDTNNSLKKPPVQPPKPRYQNFRGQNGNRRENRNQQSISNAIHMPSDHESSDHASHTNQNHLSRSNSFRDDPREGLSNVTSRDSSISSKDSHQAKRGPNYNNKSDNRGDSCQDYQSFRESSNEISNTSIKQYLNTKSFPQNKKSYDPPDPESSEMSKVPNSQSGFQSVHSSDRFPPAHEFNRNIQNRGSKRSFKGENHAHSRPPDSQSLVSDIEQDDRSNRSRNNAFKPVVNERVNNFSDKRNATDTKISPNKKRENPRNYVSPDEGFRHRSDNSYETNHSRTNSETSSIASDKRFHNNKRNKSSSISSQSSSSFKGSHHRKLHETLTDTSNVDIDSSNATLSYQKGANYQTKSDSDSRNSTLGEQKSHGNNRNKYPVAELENRPSSKTPSLRKSSCDSNTAFSNVNQSKEKPIAVDEHMQRVLNLITQKTNDHNTTSKTDKNSKFSRNEDRTSVEAHKEVGGSKCNKSNAKHINTSHSSKFQDSERGQNNVQGDKRRNSQNSVSSEFFYDNRTYDKSPGTNSNSSRDSFNRSDSRSSSSKFNNSRNFEDKNDNAAGTNSNSSNTRSNSNCHQTISNSSRNSLDRSDSRNSSTSKFRNFEDKNDYASANHSNSSRDSLSRSETRNSSKCNNSRNFEDENDNASATNSNSANTRSNANSYRTNLNSSRDSLSRSDSRNSSSSKFSNSRNFENDNASATNSNSSRNSLGRPDSRNASSSKFSKSRNFENDNASVTNSNSSKNSLSRSDSRNSSSSKFSNSRNFEDKNQTDRGVSIRNTGMEKYTSDTSRNFAEFTPSAASLKQKNCKEIQLEQVQTLNKCEEKGFFVSVSVSDNSNKEMDWKKYFINALKHSKFELDPCCKFTDSLILSFEEKCYAIEASSMLKKLKQRKIVPGQPHLILVGNLKYRRLRPCDCQDKMVYSCLIYFKEFSEKYIQEHQGKMVDVENELRSLNRGKKNKFVVEQKKVLEESLRLLEDMERVFKNYINTLKINLQSAPPNYFHICKLKSNFMRECQSFQRCLPIYSRKDDILQLLKGHSVTVVSAETGSGKSTQLAEYLLQSWAAERGTIICTQPRKMAAISITNYVCGKIGSAVGKLIGYDVGTDKKFDKDTKIIYMTDYALLKKFKRNPRLKGISCVIIDEAHERTLHTDLLLGMLKECVKLESDRLDLRVVITSATIDPSVFVRYFSFLKTAVIDVPGRAYPVEVIWLKEDVEIGWNYLKKCVETAVNIHTEEPEGDILVFLTSPSEIDEAIAMFRDLYARPHMPTLMSLHGKSDLQEQMRIFEVTPADTRKIIFATNAAETSLTIPGIKYVIDCGMAKEMTYFPAKNKNCLILTFINKSSAEQRKGRAGRTQPGICYRMYSVRNFKEMFDRASPEILRTSLQSALLKIYELGFNPDRFDFVESPSKESIAKSLESLELLNLVKNERLTDLGKKVVELPVEPRLAKLVLQGIEANVGYEMLIIAAMVREAGRLFVRADEIKVLADQKKIRFCQETGDLCTYLEVYKRWKEEPKNERYAWCVENFISSKALNSAEKTIKDVVVSLYVDLSVGLKRRYNNAAFKSNFENIVFNCFSENLCMYSGHPKVGYFSFILNDSLYIHPSSSLYYLGRDLPQFLVYSTLMETSQNFLMDITPIKENAVNKSYHKGSFNMSADVLKSLKILPRTLGPFGDTVLRNHIIGKGGSKIVNIEVMIEKLTNSRNFKIDVIKEKGTIVVYSEGRFHEKISQHIYGTVKEAQSYLAKEEDIVKTTGFFYLCIGSGGVVNDIIMPGEFREITVDNLSENQVKHVETALGDFGDLKTIRTLRKGKYKKFQISATYTKVANALEAKQELSKKNLDVKSSNFIRENNEKETPIYRIQVSWSRAISEGVGWVEFDSEADCIGASSSLTSSSFSIGHNYIRFTPSSSSVKQLDMRNLPLVVDESMIEEKLATALPSLIKPKTIYIKRRKLPAATNADSQRIQKTLSSHFGKFAAPSNMIVDVNCPAYGDPMWRAVVYFENSGDGEKAFKELVGKLCIDSVLVQLSAIRKSHLFCKSQVVKAVMGEIEQLKKEFPTTTFTFNKVQDGAIVDVGYAGQSMEDLFAVQQKLSKLFQGCTIQCHGNKKFSHLFTVRGHQLIAEIQISTKTLIMLDNIRKVISIHGPKNSCAKAQVEIYLLVEKEVSSKKKVFNLKNSSMPTGFLKCLYVKYGIDLQGLICDFSLKAAVLNAVKGTLTIEGSSGNVRKVEEHLEAICTELYNKHRTVKLEDGKEACDICLDPLSIDFHRLENCGHAFCKECLLLQVESKIVPLVCVKKDCGKEFFIVDIKLLLSRVKECLRKNFYDAALQHHVTSNIGKLSYCPIPDCYMVYRVSSGEGKLQCAGCQNTICTHCHTPFHFGMSCDMFKRCTEDEDYSLKVWMEENTHLRKQCPKCKAVIEKADGCNHMECLNCHSHMCWLCLELFAADKDVYNHLPYCSSNQN